MFFWQLPLPSIEVAVVVVVVVEVVVEVVVVLAVIDGIKAGVKVALRAEKCCIVNTFKADFNPDRLTECLTGGPVCPNHHI